MCTTGGGVGSAHSSHHLLRVSMKAPEDVDVRCRGSQKILKKREEVLKDGDAQKGKPVN
ncbi:hypothetical protein AXF42_Ash008931 [Apostasia shenzhenica]|uniref:Uncharacterized protein n=1 Tax=Apostasia shenzhenica TaxID=1088818 RepID=A0A2I0ASW8_9ASPA|nr:hypothetical protein AXF42_Ash008931 [Apostasia shenzhenica]